MAADGALPPGAADAALTNEPIVPPAGAASPLDFLVPGLVVGVPIAIVLLIVLLQVVGGVAWLPLVRRWLGRRL